MAGRNDNRISIDIEIDGRELQNLPKAVEDVLRRNVEAEARFNRISEQIKQQNANLSEAQLRRLTNATIRELNNRANAERRIEQQLQRDIERSQNERIRREQQLNQQRLRESQALANAARRQQIQAFNDELAARRRSQNSTGNQVAGSALDQIGIPIGYASATVIGIGLVTKGIKDSAQASLDFEAAARKLSQAATSAGVSYDYLAEKAQKYSKAANVSITEAYSSQGTFSRLASAAGRIEDLEKLQTVLLDIKSAFKLTNPQVDDLAQSAISGSNDDAFNRIGLADPGALKDRYAKQLGKSSESLTEQEQVLSRYIPLLEAGRKAAGANAREQESLSGQINKVKAGFEDSKTAFGDYITQTRELSDLLVAVNGLFTVLGGNIDEVRRKLAKGITPEQIVNEEFSGTGGLLNAEKNVFKGIISAIPGALFYAKDILSGEGFETANNRFGAAVNPNRLIQQDYDFRLKQIKAENDEQDKQKVAGKKEDRITRSKKLADDLRAEIQNLEKAGASSEQIKALREKIQKNVGTANPDEPFAFLNNGLTNFNGAIANNGKPTETQEKAVLSAEAAKELNSSLDKLAKKDWKKSIAEYIDFLGKTESASLAAIAKLKKDIPTVKEFLKEEDIEKFNAEIDALYKKQFEKANDLIDKFRENLVASNEDAGYLKALDSYATSAERAAKEFKYLGEQVVEAQTKINQLNALKEINRLDYQSSKSALQSEFEAFRLQNLSPTQTDGFQRRLQLVESSIQNINSLQDLDKKIAESRFYSSIFNPNNPQSFNYFNRRGNQDDLSQSSLQIRNAVENIRNLDQKANLYGTGLSGQALLADAQLARTPAIADLIKKLLDPRTNQQDKADIQFLLNRNTENLRIKRENESAKFDEALANNQFVEDQRKLARNLVRNVRDSRLTAAEKRAEIIAITEDLGTGELDPELRREKIRAKLENARDSRNMQERSVKALESMDKEIKDLKRQINENGMPVDLKDQVIANLNVSGENVEVRENNENKAPNQKSVAIKMGFFDEGGIAW